jgi:hypothetical protein
VPGYIASVNTIAIVFLGGNHERAEFVPKALDIGFGSLLPFGLFGYFRHT